ncbi:MAG TPA: hypothetical protein VKB69_07325 [Micromonosporaceae bacterium]|nr:hypothetical protein [Micromonosporaceae bacterium]
MAPASGRPPQASVEQISPVPGWVPRGSQPRHGHPRGYEQQAADHTGYGPAGTRPGMGTSTPRRGAHALPDDDDIPARADFTSAIRSGHDSGQYGDRRPYPTSGYGAGPARYPTAERGGYDDRWGREDGFPPRQAGPVSGAGGRPVSGAGRPVSGLGGRSVSGAGRTVSGAGGRPVSGAGLYPAPTSGAARYAAPISAPAHHATQAPPRPTYPTAGYPPPPASFRESEFGRGGAGWPPAPGEPYPQSRPATDPRLRPYDTGHGRHPQSDLLTPSGNIPRYVDPPGNRPAAFGFAFGFTPLSLIALILGIVGLVRSKAARKGRGLAIAAIVMSLAWMPVTYLGTKRVLDNQRAKPVAATPAPSSSSTEPAGYDPGCAASDAAGLTFNKNLQTHANDASKLLVDFKTASTALNAAANKSLNLAAATAMKKLASDLSTIYTSLSKGTAPNGAVMDRLDADAAAIDKACGKK